jgi:hypothetical protein
MLNGGGLFSPLIVSCVSYNLFRFELSASPRLSGLKKIAAEAQSRKGILKDGLKFNIFSGNLYLL